ncbi:MAG: efflux RND transporter periplasmic adaptor subunit [Minisyncoccia bacterium]
MNTIRALFSKLSLGSIRSIDWKSRRSILTTLAIVAVLVAVSWSLFGDSPAEVIPEKQARTVTVQTVAELMSGNSSLSVVGEVLSKSEAKISPETSGRITRVNVSLGSTVGAGAILAEIENTSQRAAVLQAEGSLDAAKASQGGARGSSVTTILSAYGAIDSAVSDAVGHIFSDPESSEGSFIVSSKDTQALSDIERIRPTLTPILQRHEIASASLSDSSDIGSELALLETELREVRAYLDIVLKALNAGVARTDISAATISGYVTDVTSARTGVTASLSAIAGARATTENTGVVTSSQASIKQAEGAYNAALANLEKTRIRAPISGTLNNFNIKLGDTVSQGQQVAVISNNGALEVVAFITENDRAKTSVGAKVGIEGGFTGTITRIAPALDPVTRKIEIRIGLPADAFKELTNGESVRVELMQSQSTETKVTGPLRIPIAALKMEQDRQVVYTVNTESKIVALPVTIGKLSGGFIEISEGLTAETEILADARGLKEGDSVTVSNE